MEYSLKIAESLHVGVELGGTSCKAAIFQLDSNEGKSFFERTHY